MGKTQIQANTENSAVSLDELIRLLSMDDDDDVDTEEWAGNLQLEESINRDRITSCRDDEENLLEDDDGSELRFE